MNVRWIIGVSIVAALACSSEAKAPPRAAVKAVVQEAPPAPPPPAPPPQKAASQLKVSEDIRTACALPEPQTHFAYNSAKVRAQDQTFLKQLTDCFTKGPLGKRQVRLVGHADPRGGDEYNFALARSRAESVKRAMVQLGLAHQQALTESRGKREARGTNEAEWALDRRVELALVQ